MRTDAACGNKCSRNGLRLNSNLLRGFGKWFRRSIYFRSREIVHVGLEMRIITFPCIGVSLKKAYLDQAIALTSIGYYIFPRSITAL